MVYRLHANGRVCYELLVDAPNEAAARKFRREHAGTAVMWNGALDHDDFETAGIDIPMEEIPDKEIDAFVDADGKLIPGKPVRGGDEQVLLEHGTELWVALSFGPESESGDSAVMAISLTREGAERAVMDEMISLLDEFDKGGDESTPEQQTANAAIRDAIAAGEYDVAMSLWKVSGICDGEEFAVKKGPLTLRGGRKA